MMRKHTVIAACSALVLTVGLMFLWSATSNERNGDVAANIIAANGSRVGEIGLPKKGGNRLARIFKAPFKAVGKLFDRDEDCGSPGCDYLASGRMMLEKGRLDEAIANLSIVTRLDPNSIEANKLLALAFNRKGKGEQAREAYKRVLRVAPNDLHALNDFGYSLYRDGYYIDAIKRLETAAHVAPNDKRVLNNLGLAQFKLGKYEDALSSLSRANGKFNGQLNLAALLERSGRDEEAIEHYEEALRLKNDSSLVQRRLSDLYQRTGNNPWKEERPSDGFSRLSASGN